MHTARSRRARALQAFDASPLRAEFVPGVPLIPCGAESATKINLRSRARPRALCIVMPFRSPCRQGFGRFAPRSFVAPLTAAHYRAACRRGLRGPGLPGRFSSSSLRGCIMAGSSVPGVLCSLLGSRALCAAPFGLARRPWLALRWRVVAGFALAAGACRWRLRRSARSFSGAVLCCGFSSLAAASAFAAAHAGRCGLPCAVRRFSGPLWVVSVPVAVPPALRLAPVPAVLPRPVFVGPGGFSWPGALPWVAGSFAS